jgi:hypothetical protein
MIMLPPIQKPMKVATTPTVGIESKSCKEWPTVTHVFVNASLIYNFGYEALMVTHEVFLSQEQLEAWQENDS